MKSILSTVVITLLSWLLTTLLHKFQGFNFNEELSSYTKDVQACIVDPKLIEERLDAIGGLEHVKANIKMHVLLPLKYPKIFFGNNILNPCKGILLHGPPGTGKTMLVKAIAKESNVPFISLGLATIENKYFGESSKMLTAAFKYAQKIQPCIIFFDEIDGIMRKRSDLDQSCVYGLKTEMLALIDGMHSRKQDAVVIIGCTNHMKQLDAAILRRLNRSFEIRLPNVAERCEILKLQCRVPDEWVEKLALLTDNMSGADLVETYARASNVCMQSVLVDEKFEQTLSKAKHANDILVHLPKMSLEHWEIALGKSPSCIDRDCDKVSGASPASTTEAQGADGATSSKSMLHELAEAPPCES